MAHEVTDPIEISVVIPTFNRPAAIAQCVAAIVADTTTRVVEIIVVNDGSTAVPPSVADCPLVRVVASGGRGPAAARNQGIAAARAPVVLFTDDDTLPQPGWVDALAAALVDPSLVGVAGVVDCPPYDPLYERPIASGNGVVDYLTCNIAYRTADLRAIGGFDERFPLAHAEDRDLRERIGERGDVSFCAEAQVLHPAHRFTIGQGVARARVLESDWILYSKHPALKPGDRTLRWTPIANMAHDWKRRFRSERLWRRSPRRIARFTTIAVGQLTLALWLTIRRWPPVLTA